MFIFEEDLIFTSVAPTLVAVKRASKSYLLKLFPQFFG